MTRTHLGPIRVEEAQNNVMFLIMTDIMTGEHSDIFFYVWTKSCRTGKSILYITKTPSLQVVLAKQLVLETCPFGLLDYVARALL